MTIEVMNVLMDWHVWLGAAMFGIVSRVLMRGFTSSMLSDPEFAVLMTLFNFLLVSVLMLWLGPVLLYGQRAPSLAAIISEHLSSVFLVIGIGGATRLFLQIIGPRAGSPNPKAAIQAAQQLVLLAITLSDGTAVLWPGWLFFLASVAGGLVIISAVEGLVVASVPQRAVTTTVTISGFLVLAPLLVYAAWFRNTNSSLDWIH